MVRTMLQTHLRPRIQAFIDRAIECWNSYHLDDFLDGYAPQAILLSSASKEPIRGIRNIRDFYFQHYPTAARMGALAVEIWSVYYPPHEPIDGTNVAIVVLKTVITRDDGSTEHGMSLVTFELITGGLRITHDADLMAG